MARYYATPAALLHWAAHHSPDNPGRAHSMWWDAGGYVQGGADTVSGARLDPDTWAKLWEQLRLEGAFAKARTEWPLNRRPTHPTPIRAARMRGIVQEAWIYGVNSVGLVVSKHVLLRPPRRRGRRTPLSRARLIQEAADLLAEHDGHMPQAPGSDPIDVIGGIYWDTYDAHP